MKYLQGKAGWAILIALALLFPLVAGNNYQLYVMSLAFIFAISTAGLNLITGYTGQLNLGHAGFMAIGAYTVGILTVTYEWPFWGAFAMSGVVAGVIGFFVGVVSLRLKEHFFAIFTLCVGFIIYLIIEKWDSVTGGTVGIIGIPGPAPIGPITFDSAISQYYLVVFFLVVSLWLMHRIVNSLLGRTFIAIRNSDDLAQALGINLMRNKTLSFVLSTFYAGIAGGLYAGYVRFLGPDLAGTHYTFDMITYLLVGGIGTLMGPVAGSLLVAWVTQSLQFLQDYRMVVFGPLLVLLVIFFPHGIVGFYYKKRMEREMKKRAAEASRAQAVKKEAGTNA
jgi:ABC-type branched-chain amino acid transport system, permease component